MVKCRVWMVFLVLSGLFQGVHANDFPESHVQRELGVIRAGIGLNPSSVAPGQMQFFGLSHFNFAIYRRTPADLLDLRGNNPRVFNDPQDTNLLRAIENNYVTSISLPDFFIHRAGHAVLVDQPLRSTLDEYFIFTPVAPLTGCYIRLLPVAERQQGAVFLDPCTRRTFDAAGRFLVSDEQDRQLDQMHHLMVTPHRQVTGGRIWAGGSMVDMTNPPVARIDYRSPGLLLLTAVSFNRKDLMEQALTSGASPDFRSPVYGRVLNRAVMGASSEIVRHLLELGAQPDMYTKDLAKGYDRQNIVELLDAKND